jgi:V/A-type H+/Na+-transporting ATPase subunit C
MTQKLILGKYPYTYARVSVMRASILTKDDYHKLIKMSLNEIISFLQSSEYKKAIDELGIKYSGVELMEMALSKNLVETWNKLKKISSKEVGILINAYLSRADLWNIKTILRGLHTNTRLETIASSLLPAGQLSSEKLENLSKSESVEDFLKKLSIVKIKFETMTNALETFKSKHTVVELENFFDKEYHKRMIEFSKTIPSEGKLFKQFLEAEIETTNIMNILRLKNAGANKQSIQSYIIGKISQFSNKLINSDNKEEINKMLSSQVSETSLKNFETTNSLIDIEIDLGKRLLGKTRLLLHQHPLTVDVILGYMFAKEIEVKNLKMLLKSRQLKLSEDFIEQQIIA